MLIAVTRPVSATYHFLNLLTLFRRREHLEARTALDDLEAAWQGPSLLCCLQ